MSYINIHEVDKTLQNLAPATNNNITYVPLNSTDGPSGVYTVVASYSDFVQVFGNDTNPNSTMMTSWDYAANLLLRNMPVMIRRITSYVDDEGNDGDFLPGVSTAKGLFKVKDVTGTATKSSSFESADKTFTASSGTLQDSILVSSEPTVIEHITSVDYTRGNNTVYVNVGKGSLDATTKTFTWEEPDTTSNRSTSGSIKISLNADAKIYDLKIISSVVDSSAEKTLYDIGISKYTNKDVEDKKTINVSDSKFKILLNGEIVDLTTILPSWDSTTNAAYVTIPSNAVIEYQDNIGGSKVILKGSSLESVEITTLDSASGNISTVLYTSEAVKSTCKSIQESIETFDEAKEFDDKGNINLFKVNYKYPGNNGIRFKTSIKTVDGDGIYLQVWNGTQRIENIQLVSLRYKNSNGYYAKYDLYKDMKRVWELFVSNFGISAENAFLQSALQNATTLSTSYLKINLNTNLDIENNYKCYLESIYHQHGDVLNSLTGGSSPDDADVIHEVRKTYAPLKDKYLYDIKFISNGGFVDEVVYSSDITTVPAVKRRYIEDAMIDLAQSRGDCLAFLDIPFDLEKEDTLDYFQHLSTSYATAYAPWVQFNLLTRSTKWCPPSFAALWTIAKSVNAGNAVYAPPAGVNRANLPEAVDLGYQIPSEYIDSWQDNYTQFVNPIVYINGYGVNIFGQRTLYNKVDASVYGTTSALQYLNVRLVANEVKKRIFTACIELTFEYNNLRTWLSFKTKVSKLLDQLLYNNHITNYKVTMDQTTMTDADIRAGHIVGTVSIAVATTAEKFDITFELQPNQVNFLSVDYSVDNETDQYGSPY